jgi:deazaflavin-dependent oxidoreductase (nitroreductase family)
MPADSEHWQEKRAVLLTPPRAGHTMEAAAKPQRRRWTGDLMAGERYVKPGRFTRKVFNPAVRGLTRLGISVWGSRELRVRGRRSGQWRATPVNLITMEGQRYLLAPRGTTDWVRNLRAAGSGELRVGRRCDRFAAVEVDDAAKPAIVREYLRRWKFEVGEFFGDLDQHASDDQLSAIAPGIPVFRIEWADSSDPLPGHRHSH